MRPPSALLLHVAAPCSVATRHHAGLRRAAGHKSGGTCIPRLGHDGLHGLQAAPVPLHPSFRGDAAVGQDPPPANLGSGQLHCHPRCVSLTPSRHLHGPRMIYPRPPSTSRISRCPLRGHGRYIVVRMIGAILRRRSMQDWILDPTDGTGRQEALGQLQQVAMNP